MDATPDPQADQVATEPVEPLFGSDPWMRFDMWAGRAWEASQDAIVFAKELGDRPDDAVDDRVVAMFHAAGIASGFAKLVNPADSLSVSREGYDYGSPERTEFVLGLLPDTEE